MDSEGFSGVAQDHSLQPRNYGLLSNFNGHARITGPCGDTMEFWLDVRNGKLKRVSFITDGCGSSRACGSVTTCLVEGRIVEEAASLRQQDILAAIGEFPRESEHCALLSANTLEAACEDYLKRQKGYHIGIFFRELYAGLLCHFHRRRT